MLLARPCLEANENGLQVIAGATMGQVGLLLVNAPNPGGISARPFACLLDMSQQILNSRPLRMPYGLMQPWCKSLLRGGKWAPPSFRYFMTLPQWHVIMGPVCAGPSQASLVFACMQQADHAYDTGVTLKTCPEGIKIMPEPDISRP